MSEASIRCMQLPLNELQLLLPNSAVAEIIGYTTPEHTVEGSPEWFDGKISWRGVMVPVISVEKMCQIESQKPGPRTRIAVIYNPDGSEDLPYFGIILQDIPRAYLAESDRMIENMDQLDCEFLRSHADTMLEQLVVPDLDAMVASLQKI